MEENNDKNSHGGKRQGAGRKARKVEMVAMKMPVALQGYLVIVGKILAAQLRKEDEHFLKEYTDKQLYEASSIIGGVLESFAEEVKERMRKSERENTDKRQLNLFDESSK